LLIRAHAVDRADQHLQAEQHLMDRRMLQVDGLGLAEQVECLVQVERVAAGLAEVAGQQLGREVVDQSTGQTGLLLVLHAGQKHAARSGTGQVVVAIERVAGMALGEQNHGTIAALVHPQAGGSGGGCCQAHVAGDAIAGAVAERLSGTYRGDVPDGHGQGDVLRQLVDVVGDDGVVIAKNQGLLQRPNPGVVAIRHPGQFGGITLMNLLMGFETLPMG
jgi:hypothetical protein